MSLLCLVSRLATVSVVVPFFLVHAAAKPLKVFILAGQSNMQGHANVSTFDYIGEDPKTAPMLKEMLDDKGEPKECRGVWISYVSENRNKEAAIKEGKLTAGFGARDEAIGPEFTFGLYMDKVIDEPILLIKTAWGGKSLHTDFRPPSAGVYQLNESQKERFKQQGKNLEEEQGRISQASGHYYRLMMDHVKRVLSDPKKVCPEYDAEDGYELAGFVWFQGWNDLVDSGVYPKRNEPGGYALYSELLQKFIKEVRKDLGVPELPFVIGVQGNGGETEDGSTMHHFRAAMAVPAAKDEFEGNVTAVFTHRCWDPLQTVVDVKKGEVQGEIKKLEKTGQKMTHAERQALFVEKMEEKCSPEEMEAFRGISNQAYHYLGSAKILGCIGKEFATAMTALINE